MGAGALRKRSQREHYEARSWRARARTAPLPVIRVADARRSARRKDGRYAPTSCSMPSRRRGIATGRPGARSPVIAKLADGAQALLAAPPPETMLAAPGLDLFSAASRGPDAAFGKRAPFRVMTAHRADDAVRVAAGAATDLDDALAPRGLGARGGRDLALRPKPFCAHVIITPSREV